MNLILTKMDQVREHTNLRDVFLPIREDVIKYNWLISDYEVYDSEIFNGNIRWFTGEELLNITDNNDIQFIWGVISAFDKSFKMDLNNISTIPVSYGHKTLWSDTPRIQHPDSCIEIVCIDSSSTILLSNDKVITSKYKIHYTDAKNLDEQNRLGNRQKRYVQSIVDEYFQINGIDKDNMIYISHGYSYDLKLDYNILIVNLRHVLFESDFLRVPEEKDTDEIFRMLKMSIMKKDI